MSIGRPYADAAGLWWEAGWRGVLPLPAARKGPPPSGFTGWAGIEPSWPDVQTWSDGPTGAGNIGLRLPHGVYGLDVDAYGDKDGATAVAELEAQWGPLPPTWVLTSREDNVSGIRLFRAEMPVSRRWRDEPGGHGRGIEAIHYGHRYAVAWPSVHPDTGRTYTVRWSGDWSTHEGRVPRRDELPTLPPAWIEGLSEPGEVVAGEAASHEATLAAVQAWPDGEPCERIREAASRGLARLREARDGAALHPAGRDATHELARLGHEGHTGARRALAEHYGAFIDVRTDRGGSDRHSAEAEWWRLTRGAVGKLTSPPVAACDCALRSGQAVTFDLADFDGSAGGESFIEASEESEESEESGGDGWAEGGDVGPVGIDGKSAGQGSGTGGTEGMDFNQRVDALLGEFLTTEQLIERPPPTPLVAGLLYLDSLSWLIGKSGSFKSFVALDIAQHVGLGKPWADRRVRKGPVLYLVAEGTGGMRQRLRAWTKAKETPSQDVVFLPRPVQVTSSEWETLISAAMIIKPLLIVVDTQARVTVGMKENDNTEMGQFIAQLDRLRTNTGACILVVHHIGRGGDDARGASAIDGAQDTELKIERIGDKKSMTARLVTDKQKDGPDTESVTFTMTPVEADQDPETGEPVTSLVVRTDQFIEATSTRPWLENTPEKTGRILEVLDEQFSENGATAGQVLSLLKERGWEKDYPKSSFYRCWNQLIKEQYIGKITGSQRWKVIKKEERQEYNAL